MSVSTLKVLVTGGTSGLGLAMASALAAAGATVTLTGRSAARAAEVAAGLPGAAGIGMDVREESSVARAVDQAWSRLGGIDMLVNNAGIGMRTVNPRFMSHPQGFWEVPPSGFRAVIETNLTGYFLVAREITPRMLAAGGGRIVNISVSQSTMHRAGFVPYGPSRAGSEALSKIMAADLRDTSVTVNLLLPGGATVTLADAGPAHYLLIRRPVTDGELAFYRCWAPAGAALAELVMVAGARWAVEECFRAAKTETALDHYQVRKHTAWYRHITLAVCAHAWLAVTAAGHPPHRMASSGGPGHGDPAREGAAARLRTAVRPGTRQP